MVDQIGILAKMQRENLLEVSPAFLNATPINPFCTASCKAEAGNNAILTIFEDFTCLIEAFGNHH